MDRCTDYRHERSRWQQERKGSCFVSLNESVAEAAPACVCGRWEVLSMIVSDFSSVLRSTTSSRMASCEPATASAFFNESLGILRLRGCVPAHYSSEDSPDNDKLTEHLEHLIASTEGPPQSRLRLVFHAGSSPARFVSLPHLFSLSPVSPGIGIIKRPTGVKHLFLFL